MATAKPKTHLQKRHKQAASSALQKLRQANEKNSLMQFPCENW